MGPFYLMESEAEAQRLQVKSDREKTYRQLIATGIMSLKEDPHVVDAGSGTGHVAEVMGGTLKKLHEFPRVTLLDCSEHRLAAAKTRLEDDGDVDYRYVPCDLTRIPQPSHSADYVFCRFVFEYLSDPQAVFDELFRVLKPGGKLVLGDLDYNCMTHYPLDPGLEKDLNDVMAVLQANGSFDPYAGRKLYSYFHAAKMADIKVHFYPHHLFFGELGQADEFNWLAKMERIIQLQAEGTLRFGFDLEGFRKRFLEFLRSPGRFSYTPLILVEGARPR